MDKNKSFQFEQKIKDEINSFIPDQSRKILVALSGGPDSIFLTYFLKKLGYVAIAAHVNFNLRDKESLADEVFCKDWCQNIGIEFITKSFDTKSIAQKNKLGIEETARKIRYEWFSSVCISNNIKILVTGHQLEDQAESIVMNLIRGTGINGAKGMTPISPIPYQKSHDPILLIRPLLTISKSEILEYLHLKKILYKIDSSNLQNDYTRNKIRNKILPIATEINSQSVQHIAAFGFKVQQIIPIIDAYVLRLKSKHLIDSPNKTQIKITKAINPFNLYYLLEPFGFNDAITHQMYKSILSKHKGNVFLSKEYKAILGHKTIDIIKNQEHTIVQETIDKIPYHFIYEGTTIKLYYSKSKPKPLPNQSITDAIKIIPPLKIRRWNSGDKMSPLGMQGKTKKIKNILTDSKISGADKKAALVLEDQNQIIWLACTNTISEHVKCDNKTKKFLIVEYM